MVRYIPIVSNELEAKVANVSIERELDTKVATNNMK